MSNGDWLPKPPLGVGLICVGLLLIAAWHNHFESLRWTAESRPTEQAQTAQQSNPNAAQRQQGPTRPQLADTSGPICESEADCSEKDLREQRRMADAADAQYWINRWQLILAAVAAFLLWRTLRQQAKATRASIEQAEAARRAVAQPYLQFKPQAFQFATEMRTGIGALLPREHDSVQFVLHNYGAAPAVLTHAEARLEIVDDDTPFSGFLKGDDAIPNATVHGVVIGSGLASDPYFANRERRPDEITLDSLDSWWVHGFAVYSDGLGRYYALGFCYEFRGFGWVRSTPVGFRNGDANYHREITKQPPRAPWLVRVWRAATE